MDVEARKSFKYGFVLKESDLRRLVDLARQQLEKAENGGVKPPHFNIKFRNGALANTESLDEVLEQENIGSGQIIRLKCEQATDGSAPSRILVEFVNADQDDEVGYVSLRYHVFGHNRDWVFVTSSLLEERLEKIKRFAPNQLSKQASRLFVAAILPIVMLGALFAAMLSPTVKVADRLEAAWKAGIIKDPIQALIFSQRQQESQGAFVWPFAAIAMAIAIPVLLTLVWAFFYRYYPIYNFYWGEYVEYFNKRESARKFWLVVVAVGLVLSFLGSMLANKVHW